MNTDIYKSKSFNNMYLFVREGSDLSEVPASILENLGQLDHVKTIALVSGKKLIAADPNEVIENITNKGYHLQQAEVITKDSDVSEVGAAVGGGILAASLGFGPIGAIAGAALGIWLASQSKTEEEE